MKKTLLLLILVFGAFSATAQIESGLRGGFTISGSLNSMTELPGSKSSIGWRLGYNMEYNISECFYIASGIEQTTKGVVFEGEDTPLKYYYMQIPLNVGGRIPLVENTYLFGQAGAYAAYAVATTKYNIFGLGQISGEKFDWGVNAKVGVEFGNYQIHVGYDLGMGKAWKYALNENVKHRSIYLGLTIAY